MSWAAPAHVELVESLASLTSGVIVSALIATQDGVAAEQQRLGFTVASESEQASSELALGGRHSRIVVGKLPAKDFQCLAKEWLGGGRSGLCLQ